MTVVSRRRRAPWGIGIGLALLLVAALTVAAPASAHAEFVRSTPAPYDMWSYAPSEVIVTVSEAVQPGSQSIVVTNAQGLPVDVGPTVLSPSDPTTFSVKIAGVTPSVYTVIWSVISSDDGHYTTDYFFFMVRYENGTVPGAFPTSPPPGFGASSSGQPLPPMEVALRSVLFVGFAVVFGGLVFLLLVWLPSLERAEEGGQGLRRDGLRALLRLPFLGAVAYSASLAALWANALIGTAVTGPADLLSSPFLISVAARIPLAVGMLVLLAFARKRVELGGTVRAIREDLLWALGFALVAMGMESLVSHSAYLADWWPVGPIADAMHLYAAAIWIGGLVALVRVRAWLREPAVASFASGVLRAFSRNATAAVALLIFGGILLEIMLVGSLYALLTMPYGWTVLAKSLLLVPMLVLALANHRRVAKLEAGAGEDRERIRTITRAVSAEMTLGVVVLVAAALLTSMYPPVTPPQSQYLSQNAVSEGFFALFQVFPYPRAPQSYIFTIELWLTANGSPYVGLDNTTATMTFVRQGGGVNATLPLLGPHGPNHWYVQADVLSQPGTYDVEVRFVRLDGSGLSFPFQVTVYTPFYVPFDVARATPS